MRGRFGGSFGSDRYSDYSRPTGGGYRGGRGGGGGGQYGFNRPDYRPDYRHRQRPPRGDGGYRGAYRGGRGGGGTKLPWEPRDDRRDNRWGSAGGEDHYHRGGDDTNRIVAEPRLQYEARIGFGPFTTPTRDYFDLRQRYPNLYISNDMTHVNILWPQHVIHFNKVTRGRFTFNHGLDLCMLPPPTRTAQVQHHNKQYLKHNVRIVLITHDNSSNTSGSTSAGDDHPLLQLKFLVCRTTTGLRAVGGSWRSDDGEDPNDNDTLWVTAQRTAKEMCGLDLSDVSVGTPFMEIHYSREDESEASKNLPAIKERTVFFAVYPEKVMVINPDKASIKQLGDSEYRMDLYTQVQDIDKVKSTYVRTQQEESGLTENVFANIEKEIQQQIVLQPLVVSLNGLLDYDKLDYHEKTTELSLFAEVFYEMLETECGRAIFEGLEKQRVTEEKQKEAESGDEPEPKKRKTHIAATLEGALIPLLDPNIVKSEDIVGATQAFQFFDSRKAGYLKAGDVETILYGMGACLPRRVVHRLVKYFVKNVDEIDYTEFEDAA